MQVKIWVDYTTAWSAVCYALYLGDKITSRKAFRETVRGHMYTHGESYNDDISMDFGSGYGEEATRIMERYYE